MDIFCDVLLTPKPVQKYPNCTGKNFPKVWRHLDNRNMFVWNFMFFCNGIYEFSKFVILKEKLVPGSFFFEGQTCLLKEKLVF